MLMLSKRAAFSFPQESSHIPSRRRTRIFTVSHIVLISLVISARCQLKLIASCVTSDISRCIPNIVLSRWPCRVRIQRHRRLCEDLRRWLASRVLSQVIRITRMFRSLDSAKYLRRHAPQQACNAWKARANYASHHLEQWPDRKTGIIISWVHGFTPFQCSWQSHDAAHSRAIFLLVSNNSYVDTLMVLTIARSQTREWHQASSLCSSVDAWSLEKSMCDSQERPRKIL